MSGWDTNRTFIFPRCCFNHEAERGLRGEYLFLFSPSFTSSAHIPALAHFGMSTRDTKKHTHSAAHTANMEPVGSRPSGEKVKCLLRLYSTRRVLCGIQALCIYIVCVFVFCVCVCVFAFKVLIIWIHVISNCAFGQYFPWKYSHNDFWTSFIPVRTGNSRHTNLLVRTHTHTHTHKYLRTNKVAGLKRQRRLPEGAWDNFTL